MLRELTNQELNNVSGGGNITDVYPVVPSGYEIIGWSEQIIGWDTISWTENRGLFTIVEHVDSMPIYDIQPIYALRPATVVYY